MTLTDSLPICADTACNYTDPMPPTVPGEIYDEDKMHGRWFQVGRCTRKGLPLARHVYMFACYDYSFRIV
jgi:hypothetical protein